MKRALVVMIAVAAPARARADDWSGGVEAAAEGDSNVHRIEVAPDGSGETPETAGLVRLGARGAGRGDTRYGAWIVDGLGLLRAVASPSTVSGESVAVVAGDARWDVAIPHRTARAFVRGDVYDVLGLEAVVSARTFTSRGAEAGLVLADGDRTITVTGGARDFTYKPDRDFDWRGPSLGVRVDAPLWRAGGDEPRSLDLTADYRVERRAFTGLAYADGCMPGAAPDPKCYVPTTAPRSDVYHRALARVTYTGERVFSLGYELVVDSSTSYGQSVDRHRVLASATTALPWRAIATASAILELDRYPAPLLVSRDVSMQTFTTIDDDNRNMVSLLVGRPVGGGWAVEARGAYWADAFSSDQYRFRRWVWSLGVTWGHVR